MSNKLWVAPVTRSRYAQINRLLASIWEKRKVVVACWNRLLKLHPSLSGSWVLTNDKTFYNPKVNLILWIFSQIVVWQWTVQAEERSVSSRSYLRTRRGLAVPQRQTPRGSRGAAPRWTARDSMLEVGDTGLTALQTVQWMRNVPAGKYWDIRERPA